ncbi:MAG TPA: hypothetical protein PLE60_15245, partial [Candidatus Latescibacteria bacterium]|nr:hypothetical protein [Candidatus Latescibacterota bacterium]
MVLLEKEEWLLLRMSFRLGGSFPIIGKLEANISNHWKLFLLLFFLFLSVEAQAFTCTTAYDSIAFSVSVPTVFDHEPQPGAHYWGYTAELVPGDEVIVDATAPGNTNPTNTDCELFVRYLVVGYRTCRWNANESFDCPGGMVFFPRKELTYIPVNYGCEVFFCPPSGGNGQSAHINARIRPAQAIEYSPGYFPDLRGDPDE